LLLHNAELKVSGFLETLALLAMAFHAVSMKQFLTASSSFWLGGERVCPGSGISRRMPVRIGLITEILRNGNSDPDESGEHQQCWP
jgi:hypothetical protein